MVIQAIDINSNKTKSQPTLKQKKVVKPYLEASQKITTNNNVKPLPGEGYLIHDNPVSSVKYFFKDIAYDLKSLRNGYKGTANDHQLGRLNDVGLRLGGLGIATYLASQTTNPKAKLMEFIGLGAFLTSMSIFPKIAINKPARIMHGFDIDKEYIDDQGRKKSVFQDSNYIPYDLYRGEKKSEDLDVIGDRMGIPRDIVNRHDIIKEQMRKIATQNNTLWMLAAGPATPALAGLACCLLEEPVSSGIAHYRNNKHNEIINNLLKTTSEMDSDLSNLKENSLSKDIKKILMRYKNDGLLPDEELKHITSCITEGLDYKTADSLTKDIQNIFETSASTSKSLAIFDKDRIANYIKSAKKGVKASRQVLDTYILPSSEEFSSAIKEVLPNADLTKEVTLKNTELNKLRKALEGVIDKKIATADADAKKFLEGIKATYLANLFDKIDTKKALIVNDTVIDKINKLTMIVSEFKANNSLINKCINFKFAHAPETIIANYSGKFERTLLNELNFTQEELKNIRASADYAKEILDKRLSEIASDEIRYNRIVKKLVKVISDMETALHGAAENESVIKNLVESIENNANNTAQRLNNLKGFDGTIKVLVNDKVENLTNKFNSQNTFRDLLDGSLPNLRNGEFQKEISGIGSLKNMQIANITERYQGSTNSFFRILEALDVYKRATNANTFTTGIATKQNSKQYLDDLIRASKETILNANCANHINKLNTINNGEYYKDLMNSLFRIEFEEGTYIAKGILSSTTEEAFGENAKSLNLLDRFKKYIGRIHDIIPNNECDYTKNNTHRVDPIRLSRYDKTALTDKAIFDLIGQEPTELVRGAADRRYGTRKWLSIIGGITASVFAVTLLAQLAFGKLQNPENMKKQVNDDANT